VRHFEPLPAGRGWRFNSRLCDRMRWLQLDLSQSCAPVGVADLVVCHQKLGAGELDRGSGRPLLARLSDQLASDGFLVLRSPESTLECGAGFERVCAAGPAVYRRVAREPSLLSA
jgi:chemotaxis methyl-accepting protein methylase